MPRCSVTPRASSESWTGLATSGSRISCSTHGPSSTRSTCSPRWARPPAISTPTGPAPTTTIRFIESSLLVELHRLADVLDVVDAVEVHAGHVGLLPEEARAEDELVEALGLVLRRDRAPVEVDVGDDRLHAHVQAVLAVALDGGEEEVVEARDLAAVDERDAARRVGDVRELGEDAHLELRIQALGDGRGRRPRAASADDDYALHGDSSRSKIVRSESSSRRRCRRQAPPSRATTAGRRSPNSVDWTCW